LVGAKRRTGVGPPQALTSAACDEQASEFNTARRAMFKSLAYCFALGAVLGTAGTMLALHLYDQ
jgi:hypothetical protein